MSTTTRGTSAWALALAGLVVALALALLGSPFASGSPDGLERVAQDQGFADRADDHALSDSPVADYQVDGVHDERLSTGLSGVLGVALAFGLGLGLFGLLRLLGRRPPR